MIASPSENSGISVPYMKRPVNSPTARTMFIIGPAEATRNRCHLGLERNSFGAPVTESPGFSPAILTYPPSGNALMR